MQLAHAHKTVEPDIVAIYRVRDPLRELDSEEPIKLLEVNPSTSASGIMPIGFRSDTGMGIPYPSVIMEVTPDEWKRIQSGDMALPNNWRADTNQLL